jgi:hypothetical protein
VSLLTRSVGLILVLTGLCDAKPIFNRPKLRWLKKAVGLADSLLLLRLDVVLAHFFFAHFHSHNSSKSSKRAIPEMILFPILKFASTSYRMSNLCWSKNAPALTPPPSPPMGQRSIMMGAVITFLRLPVISYQAYSKFPRSVRPPRLLLLVLLLLLSALILLLCILLVLLVLLTVVTTGILLLLLILLPPGTLTTMLFPIRSSVTQFLAQVTRSYLPSPIQALFSALFSFHRGLLNREESFVAQTAPNIAPVPNVVVVVPTCLPDSPPPPPPSTLPRTLRRSKSWFRW